MTSNLITLPQMVDLALGQNQHNIVNFSVLHSLLHLIIRHMNFQSTRVEFADQNAEMIGELIQNVSANAGSLHVKEYEVVQNQIGYDIKKTIDGGENKKEDEIKYVISIEDGRHDSIANDITVFPCDATAVALSCQPKSTFDIQEKNVMNKIDKNVNNGTEIQKNVQSDSNSSHIN